MNPSQEDCQTNTVDGAAVFERARAEEHDEQPSAEDGRPVVDWEDEDAALEDEDSDYCGCSDVLYCPGTHR